MKRCPVTWCTTQIAEKQLLCYLHWDMLPSMYKRRTNRQWYVGGEKDYVRALTAEALSAIRDLATAR